MNKTVLHTILQELDENYPCCKFASILINNLQDRERDFFNSFMPDAKSAIVVGHHIQTIKEWTWYQPPEGHERCDADDHTFDVCNKIKNELETKEFESKIVPYPEESGLQFRYVAQSAGLGKIGKNAFLLHPDWGPWIHLRVLATKAQIDKKICPNLANQDFCNDCNICVDSCPAGALENGFNGLACRKYREERGEYNPIGKNRIYQYCLICALACPIGTKPSNK